MTNRHIRIKHVCPEKAAVVRDFISLLRSKADPLVATTIRLTNRHAGDFSGVSFLRLLSTFSTRLEHFDFVEDFILSRNRIGVGDMNELNMLLSEEFPDSADAQRSPDS